MRVVCLVWAAICLGGVTFFGDSAVGASAPAGSLARLHTSHGVSVSCFVSVSAVGFLRKNALKVIPVWQEKPSQRGESAKKRAALLPVCGSFLTFLLGVLVSLFVYR